MACIFVLMSVSPAVGAEEADQSVQNGCHSVDAQMQLSDAEKLTDTAKAVIVYELKSDTMVYAYNPDGKIYPSSMVKLMTALVALEHGKMTDKVVVTKRALSYVAVGSVSAGLIAGEELTLGDLLYCMMAQSANDAATVIAEHIAGSQDAFIKLMNEKAAALGCTGTSYSNVHGLHDEQTYTTARDICRILDVALENADFKTLFQAKSYVVPKTNKSEAREIYSSNYMMCNETVKKYLDERVTGGKTGATDQAGRCLAATAEGMGMELLTIVMGAKATYELDGLAVKTFGSFEETKQLLDYTMTNFEFRQIFYPGQAISQYPVANGANAVVVQSESVVSTVLPVGMEAQQLNWLYFDTVGGVSAPVKKGQAISSVQVWYGSKCVAQTNLVAAYDVAMWSEPVNITGVNQSGKYKIWQTIGMILAVIFGLALLGIAWLFLRREIYRWIRKAKIRKRRANRRRNR